MEGYGTYCLKPGSWSDDTSMSLCLADSLAEKNTFDCTDVMEKFAEWYLKGKYTPDGKAYDVGHTCGQAIFKWGTGRYEPITWGGRGERNNGNGSLMRISPLPFYIMSKLGELAFSTEDSFNLIHDVSSLTHAHIISLIGCDIYCAVMHQIILGTKKEKLLVKAMPLIGAYIRGHEDFAKFFPVYDRLCHENFTSLPEKEKKTLVTLLILLKLRSGASLQRTITMTVFLKQ